MHIGFGPGLVGHPQRVDQVFPVFNDGRTIFARPAQARQIVHNGNSPFLSDAARKGIGKNGGRGLIAPPGIIKKALHKNAVHAILLHPFKMQIDGAFVV